MGNSSSVNDRRRHGTNPFSKHCPLLWQHLRTIDREQSKFPEKHASDKQVRFNCSHSASNIEGRPKHPSFLVIVADGLGFSDTSPFCGEIGTPNLMKPAKEGLRFTDFHTAASRSRIPAILMSGTDPNIAGLGCMAEKIKKAPGLFKGREDYEGYLNVYVAALLEILQDEGYFTFMSGK